jgi:hypothetical protein
MSDYYDDEEIECFHDGDVRVDILTGERWCEECGKKLWRKSK